MLPYLIQATDDSTCVILIVFPTMQYLVHNHSKTHFFARRHPTFLSQQLPQLHRWPAARSSRRRHPPPPTASSVADDLAPRCQPGRKAADAANARLGRHANAEEAAVVLRSPPVVMAPSRSRPPSLRHRRRPRPPRLG